MIVEGIGGDPEGRQPGAGGVPFMMTAQMRGQLHELGYTDDTIRHMTPTESHRIIHDGLQATGSPVDGRDEGGAEVFEEPQPVTLGPPRRTRITL